jgi:hypothetical protein
MMRLRLGVAAAGFALAGLAVALGDRRLVWVAIAVLVVALLLRFL